MLFLEALKADVYFYYNWWLISIISTLDQLGLHLDEMMTLFISVAVCVVTVGSEVFRARVWRKHLLFVTQQLSGGCDVKFSEDGEWLISAARRCVSPLWSERLGSGCVLTQRHSAPRAVQTTLRKDREEDRCVCHPSSTRIPPPPHLSICAFKWLAKQKPGLKILPDNPVQKLVNRGGK